MAPTTHTTYCPDIHLSKEEDYTAGKAWSGYYSDHLMARGEVDGVHIGTLNLLNTKYVYRLAKYKSGWTSSEPYKLHRLPETLPYTSILPYPADKEKIDINSGLFLTERDLRLLDKIEAALFSGDHSTPPLDILALQECSTAMALALEFRLKSRGIQVILNRKPELNGDAHNYVALLVNTKALSILADPEITPVFERPHPESPPGAPLDGEISREDEKFGLLYLSHLRPVLDIVVMNNATGKTMRFIATHIPTAGESDEFQIHNLKRLFDYATKESISSQPTIVLGDFNTGPINTSTIFGKDFKELVDHYTNIDEEGEVRQIDHILTSKAAIDSARPSPMGDDEKLLYKAAIEPFLKELSGSTTAA